MSMFQSLIACALLVLAIQATKQCPVHETFRSCGTACEPSCTNPNPTFCTKQCILDVCQCDSGYVRSNSSGCVPVSECPRTTPSPVHDSCRSDEQYNSCGGCEQTCENQNMACITLCGPGACRCKPGLVRHSSGRCVPVSQCSAAPSCATTICKIDEICLLENVVCVRAPCYPIPFCYKIEDNSQCAAVSCPIGNQCVVRSNQPMCVPNVPQNDTSALEHPCLNHTCKIGENCVERQVQCFAAPCYPIAECVQTTTDPCQTVRCGFNTECKNVKGSARCMARDSNTTVVPEVCPTNQTFVQCSSHCPTKCNENLMMACIQSCGPPACSCSTGYYLTDDFTCVLPKDCPITNATSINNSTTTVSPLLTCATVDCATGYTCGIVNGIPFCMPENSTSNSTLITTTSSLTCATVKCAGGSTCTIVNGGPRCLPPNSTFNSTLTTTTSSLTCATVKCAGGSVCTIVNGGPRCMPSNSTSNSTLTTTTSSLTCATVKCAGGSICQIVNGGPRCISSNSTESSCNLIDCRTGLVCRMVGNQPTCVRDNSTPSQCASMSCSTGSECRMMQNGTVGCVLFNSTDGGNLCGKNEMLGMTAGCEPTCTEPLKVCSNSTTQACICAGGFVRKGRRCVPYAVCPDFPTGVTGNETCSNTEVYSDKKNACETSCHGNDLCKTQNNSTIVAGCVCRKFYKRNENGNCVHQRFCYKSAGCRMNESWAPCIECEGKCNKSDSKCGKSCTSGCGCDSGYSRNANMTCVPDNTC